MWIGLSFNSHKYWLTETKIAWVWRLWERRGIKTFLHLLDRVEGLRNKPIIWSKTLAFNSKQKSYSTRLKWISLHIKSHQQNWLSLAKQVEKKSQLNWTRVPQRLWRFRIHQVTAIILVTQPGRCPLANCKSLEVARVLSMYSSCSSRSSRQRDYSCSKRQNMIRKKRWRTCRKY